MSEEKLLQLDDLPLYTYGGRMLKAFAPVSVKLIIEQRDRLMAEKDARIKELEAENDRLHRMLPQERYPNGCDPTYPNGLCITLGEKL